MALLVGGGGVAGWLGAVPAGVLAALGAGLVGFAALVGWVAWRPTPARAVGISALDVGWVLATVPLPFVSDLFTQAGAVAVVAVAVAVGGFAAAQLAGVRRMVRNPNPAKGLYRHCVRVRASADADAMWAVASDLGGIARFSPGLASSTLEGNAPAGVGAVRTCSSPNGQTWSEACEAFDPARRTLRLRFLADRPGFPYPATVMHGGWRIDPDGDGCVVEVWWTLTPTVRPGWLMVALIGLRVDRDFAAMVGRMAEVANGRPVPQTPPRLTPAFC